MMMESFDSSEKMGGLLEAFLPGVSPEQGLTFMRRFTTEQRGLGTKTVLEVYSKYHQAFHGRLGQKWHDRLIKKRDWVSPPPLPLLHRPQHANSFAQVGDHVWKSIDLEDGGKMIIDVFHTCERADAPHQKDKIRATNYSGVIFETCAGGSKYTFMARVDPRGGIPAFVVNRIAEGE